MVVSKVRNRGQWAHTQWRTFMSMWRIATTFVLFIKDEMHALNSSKNKMILVKFIENYSQTLCWEALACSILDKVTFIAVRHISWTVLSSNEKQQYESQSSPLRVARQSNRWREFHEQLTGSGTSKVHHGKRQKTQNGDIFFNRFSIVTIGVAHPD